MTKKQIEEEIQSITKQLIEKYQPEKIILFGSAARGEFEADSDLDFLVVKKDVPQNGIERRWQVRRLIQKTVSADFLIFRPEEFKIRLQSNDPFVKTISNEGRILYG